MKINNYVFLILLWTSFLSSDIVEFPHILSFSEFKEDSSRFNYDVLIELDDGSSWKVHPDDETKLHGWEIGQKVYISPRTSSYWFSRDHHFDLHNSDLKEFVHVMLVYHREYPREIIDYTAIYDSYYQKDATGYNITFNKARFRQTLLMDDGTSWELRDHFYQFLPDTTIYIGWDGQKKIPILISGRLNNPTWTYLYPSK